MNKLNPIPLSGIEGHNLLGFLAALGVLYELDQAASGEVRLSWRQERSTWKPVIWHQCVTGEEIVALLAKRLCTEPRPVPPVVKRTLKIDATQFRNFAEQDRNDLALLAALAIEANKRDKPEVQDTDFRGVGGGNNNDFLQTARNLISKVDPKKLSDMLFESWSYEDVGIGMSLRWDPADYRPHALRGLDPSVDPLRAVWWANRLAFSALPLFPCYPSSRGLRTAGFDQSRNPILLWPIWRDPITVDVLRSLIPFTRLLFEGESDIGKRGIQAIYQSQRIEKDHYRNFTLGRTVS